MTEPMPPGEYRPDPDTIYHDDSEPHPATSVCQSCTPENRPDWPEIRAVIGATPARPTISLLNVDPSKIKPGQRYTFTEANGRTGSVVFGERHPIDDTGQGDPTYQPITPPADSDHCECHASGQWDEDCPVHRTDPNAGGEVRSRPADPDSIMIPVGDTVHDDTHDDDDDHWSHHTSIKHYADTVWMWSIDCTAGCDIDDEDDEDIAREVAANHAHRHHGMFTGDKDRPITGSLPGWTFTPNVAGRLDMIPDPPAQAVAAAARKQITDEQDDIRRLIKIMTAVEQACREQIEMAARIADAFDQLPDTIKSAIIEAGIADAEIEDDGPDQPDQPEPLGGGGPWQWRCTSCDRVYDEPKPHPKRVTMATEVPLGEVLPACPAMSWRQEPRS